MPQVGHACCSVAVASTMTALVRLLQLAVVVVVGSASVQSPPVLELRRRRDSIVGV